MPSVRPPTAVADAVCAHLGTPFVRERVHLMLRHEFQTELWFDIELLALFERLCETGALAACQRQVRVPGGRLDFLLAFGDRAVAVELKTALVGRQKGQLWSLPSYDYFLIADVGKLAHAARDPATTAFSLVLAHAAPPIEHWKVLAARVATKCPEAVVEVARVDEVSADFAIGWLAVEPATPAPVSPG